MKTIQVFVMAIIASLALAEVDWSQVKIREEAPGFWDNRLFKPKMITRHNFHSSSDGRIVGGWEVQPNEIPHQAGLLMEMGAGVYLCGGSIITPSTVLTAAHCTEDTTRTQVRLGAHRLSSDDEPTQQRFLVERSGYRFHPLYNWRTFNNDVCILLLPASIKYTPQVQHIELPRSIELQQNLFDGKVGTVR